MKTPVKNILCLMVCSALAACGSKSSKSDSAPTVDGYTKSKNGVFLAKVEWPEALKAGQGVDNKAIVTFLTPDEKVPGEVSFTGFHPRMPAHGHGTTETNQKLTARTDEPNVYDVTGVMFIMAGEANTWVTDVDATVDGKEDEVTIPVSRDVE